MADHWRGRFQGYCRRASDEVARQSLTRSDMGGLDRLCAR